MADKCQVGYFCTISVLTSDKKEISLKLGKVEMKFCQKHYSIAYQGWMKMGQVLFAENITVTYDVNSSLVVIALLRNQQLIPT